MDVSIIIVNYNTETLVIEAVNSIYEKTTDLIFEVIVVDNNSPQKPTKINKDSRIKYIQSDKNLGFGKANNLGSRSAKGKYLFFLNPDTLFCNNAILILMNTLENNPNIGICGGNLFDNEMRAMHSYSIVPPGIKNELLVLTKDFFGLLHDKEFNTSRKLKEVEYITGADLMIPKCLFDEVGGFDKDFFMYFEETYLCYQVKSKGYLIVCNPNSKIIHLESKSIKYKKYKDELYYYGRKKYLTKRYGKMYCVVCNIIHFLTCMSRILVFIFNKQSMMMWMYRIKLLFN